MLDMSRLMTLSVALEEGVKSQDLEAIQALCDANSAFILSIVPQSNSADNDVIRHFIALHRAATLLVRDAHSELQQQLHQTHKTRKGVSKYKGVKNAK
ncbi:hypothetical protein [Marinomonas algarum]|uniref:Uncharacterized protein n=1 Tax=Marinomonas algarum TaxID=2883105 RepID=A0A9X1INV4_9GAMM|nr:hypothetical protein [Marinomonas algarum]MCB5162864.1 hypothetical protein [Marinomonas algarum]